MKRIYIPPRLLLLFTPCSLAWKGCGSGCVDSLRLLFISCSLIGRGCGSGCVDSLLFPFISCFLVGKGAEADVLIACYFLLYPAL